MDFETKVVIRVFFFLLPLFIVVGRLIWITPSTNSIIFSQSSSSSSSSSSSANENESLLDSSIGSNIMIFLGSGGHTGEMMKLLNNIDISNLSRTWIISSNDTSSLNKCKEFENSLQTEFKAEFLTLHRARSVSEPVLASIKNTLISFIDTILKIQKLPKLPSVLIINGPGTSVPIAYILFVYKFLGLSNTRIIYVESLARVDDLSLSGKLVLPICDRFIVQWHQLAVKYKRAEYYGILV